MAINLSVPTRKRIMFERIQTDGIVTLRMVHGRANAWDVEFVEGFRRELDAAAGARALIITAAGKIFCAGVDLPRLLDEGTPYVERFIPLMGSFVRELFAMPIPVIASVNGHAIAGGGILSLASDYVVMAEGDGRIGIPELTVGVPFPTAPLEVVRYAVPGDRLRTIVNLGRTLRPHEALAHGLVDEVVPPEVLEERSMAVALQLAAIPAASFRLTKLGLRAEALARIDREGPAYDAQAMAVWADPSTHAHLRDYLARVLGRG
jgi:enoyl-CoA hydratase